MIENENENENLTQQTLKKLIPFIKNNNNEYCSNDC